MENQQWPMAIAGFLLGATLSGCVLPENVALMEFSAGLMVTNSVCWW